MHMMSVHSANSTIDTAVLWPLLERALQFHSHFQTTAADGSIHLEATFSPEYPGPAFPDAGYDLALLRWALGLALDLSARYNLTSAHLPTWRTTLRNLTWFPIDPITDTLEIYAGHPYSTPHRHFSHLFSIWPLRLLNVSNATNFETAKKSINLWLATPEEDSMFYRPAASAMNLLLGQRAAAFDNITHLLYSRIEGTTWYREGAAGSCTETPYAAAWALTDWLLQSWNRTREGDAIIDFFPGIDDVIALGGDAYTSAPARAASAAFWRLSAEGHVLASAAREEVVRNATHYVTRPKFVAVETDATWGASQRLVLRSTLAPPLAVEPPGTPLQVLGEGLVALTLGPSAAAVVYSAALPKPNFTISPSSGCPAEFNHYSIVAPQPGGSGDPIELQQCSALDAQGRVQPSQRFAYLPTTRQFALQDGTGRCLSVQDSAGGLGARAVLLPCAASPSSASAAPIGCRGSSGGAGADAWLISPQGLGIPAPSIVLAASNRCLEVHGAYDPTYLDVWDCAGPPGAVSNVSGAACAVECRRACF